MRYMIIVKATEETEAGVMPEAALIARMTAYHEALAQAGVLLDAAGLKPSAAGWRIRFDGETRTRIDGPFTESKGLIAGYTLIEVRSREEAEEWARRYPNPAGAGGKTEIEIRPLFEPEDFGPSETVDRLRELDEGGTSLTGVGGNP